MHKKMYIGIWGKPIVGAEKIVCRRREVAGRDEEKKSEGPGPAHSRGGSRLGVTTPSHWTGASPMGERERAGGGGTEKELTKV